MIDKERLEVHLNNSKAEELKSKFLNLIIDNPKFKNEYIELSRKIAVECVNEIILALEEYDERTSEHIKNEFGEKYDSFELQNMEQDFRYWEKVKNDL